MAVTDLKARLGAAIKAERSALRISQEELAYRAGLHRTYVSDVERGARNLSLQSVEKLAQALQLSVPVLFERAHGNGSKQLVEIFLVEDNPRDVQLIKSAFEKARVSNPLHVASDGEEAIAFLFATGAYAHRANVNRPLLVLLNLNLPKKTGLEVLRQIKTDKRTCDIPVIVLTVSTRARDIDECRRLGADKCIVKPFEFENFSEVTRRLHLDWALMNHGPG